MDALIAAALALYLADARLAVVTPGGQTAPDDYGAFISALAAVALTTGAPAVMGTRYFQDRAWRHYDNARFRGGKDRATAFADGLKLAFAGV